MLSDVEIQQLQELEDNELKEAISKELVTIPLLFLKDDKEEAKIWIDVISNIVTLGAVLECELADRFNFQFGGQE